MLFKAVVNLSIAFGFFIVLSACTRSDEGTSKVKIQMPSLATIGSSKVSSQKILDVGGDWGLSDPTSISEIGCWGVLVKDSSSNTGTCAISSGSNFRTIAFLEKAGLSPSGGALEVEVKPGQKTFYLVGFKSSVASCDQIESIKNSNLSSPFILGEASKNIQGSNDSVVINASLNVANLDASRIGNCSFTGNKSITAMKLIGSVNYNASNSNYELHIKNQTCAKFYLKLTSGNDGGGINDKSRTIKITYGASTNSPGWVNSTTEPFFYSDNACTAVLSDNSTVAIPAGENAIELYARADGNGWTNGDEGSRSFNLIDLGGEIQGLGSTFRIAEFSSSSPKMNFYSNSLNIASGQGKEIDYYYTDSYNSYNFAVPRVTSNTITIQKLDLTTSGPTLYSDSGFGTTATSGMRSASYSVPTATSANESFGSTFFRVDANWSSSVGASYLDLALYPSTSGSNPLWLNVNSVSPLLDITTSNSNIFASDCVLFSLNAKNTLNVLSSFYGTDSQGIDKRLNFNAHLNGSGSSGPIFSSNDCTSVSTNEFSWVPTSGQTQLQFSGVPGNSNSTVKLSLNAYPFYKSDHDNLSLSINPLWDPSQLTGSILKKWWMPWNNSGIAPNIPSYYSNAPFSSSLGFATPSDLVSNFYYDGGGSSFSLNNELGGSSNRYAFDISSATGRYAKATDLNSLGFSGSFLVGVLIKITSSPVSDQGVVFIQDNVPSVKAVIKIKSGGSQLIPDSSLAGTNTSGGATLTATGSKWYVVFIKRDSSDNLTVAVNNGLDSTTSVNTPNSPNPFDAVGFGATGSDTSNELKVAEMVILDTSSLTNSDITSKKAQLYNYFKARYLGTTVGSDLP